MAWQLENGRNLSKMKPASHTSTCLYQSKPFASEKYYGCYCACVQRPFQWLVGNFGKFPAKKGPTLQGGGRFLRVCLHFVIRNSRDKQTKFWNRKSISNLVLMLNLKGKEWKTAYNNNINLFKHGILSFNFSVLITFFETANFVCEKIKCKLRNWEIKMQDIDNKNTYHYKYY